MAPTRLKRTGTTGRKRKGSKRRPQSQTTPSRIKRRTTTGTRRKRRRVRQMMAPPLF